MSNTAKKLSPTEEAELKKLEAEEEDAKRQALEAAKIQNQAAQAVSAVVAHHPAPVAKPAPKKFAGDIPVTCLKTETTCRLGGRTYNLVRGAELMMDPSHAEELAQGGWVSPVSVVRG